MAREPVFRALYVDWSGSFSYPPSPHANTLSLYINTFVCRKEWTKTTAPTTHKFSDFRMDNIALKRVNLQQMLLGLLNTKLFY